MENVWNLLNFTTSSSSNSSFGRVHNSRNNCTTPAWDVVSESGTSSTNCSRIIDWGLAGNGNNLITNSRGSFPSSSSSIQEKTAAALQLQALMVSHEGSSNGITNDHYPNSVDPSRLYYSRPETGRFPDRHLMCLKLGKRHYFGDATTTTPPQLADDVVHPNYYSITKKGKPYYYDVAGVDGGFVVDVHDHHHHEPSIMSMSSPATGVPRCQVDGCNAVLLNAKDYHKRHKVCESHSKAPKVLVLGLEQRFCQQCSRFHAVSEFDESKRSCRRRLAGHNERRRKSSQLQEHSSNRNQFQGRHEYMQLNNGCALSLLSSKNESWISSTDLPARCSAALRELIAENRAAILSRQLILDKDWWHWQYYYHNHQDMTNNINGLQQIINNNNNPTTMGSNNSNYWERISGEETAADAQLTLNLMQEPENTAAFGFLSTMRGKSKEDDEECPELWNTSFGGAHVL